ncbi:MAG TPA: M1 family metallopeptidase, partial [Candidatus Obscuribacter sp.]|nr:M1 family metallopeptidase [Candidatus Obscuribacter sp.]
MLHNIEGASCQNEGQALGAGARAEADFRLCNSVKPSHYDIHLTPDLEQFTFDGEVTIEVELEKDSQTIRINAKELDLHNFSAQAKAGGKELLATIAVCEESEIATLTFAESLKAGQWVLKSQFKGTLNDKLKGFYRSFWTDEKGGKHAIATTQFESTDARRAFPCFDEPAYKATFDVRLTVPEKLTALSNGAIIKTETEGGKKTITYERTMKMSTYLVCFCVGEFVSSQPVMVNGTEVRIWSVPGKEKLTQFALDTSAFAIDFYEKYFEIPYPGGKKIDHIAIPDFASGAMENLGLITYRETALLLDDSQATHAERKRVAEVVMHELAHMWFGDLVTMGWWNGLWLNESFATFMENICLHNWKPEWEIWNDFGLSRAAASRVDALKSTHPIECPVNHPDEAAEMFDVISYEKGCSVLYQIHEFIGGETFRRGIAAYLKKHSYGNTETHDLWDALEEACQKAAAESGKAEPEPVRLIMDKWVFTPGHPVLEVSGDKCAITFKQRPFKFLSTDDKTLWPIPVCLKA